ncbi:MAG: hypothetical protein ACI8QC_001364 [Planctomycetota bacterium]|jgi:hypothetical protein
MSFASPASAQHKQEKHPEIGIERIDRPRRFDAIPTTPDEKFIQLKWKERAPDPKRKSEKKRRMVPELYLVFIPRSRLEPSAPGERRTTSRSSKKSKVVDDLPSWVRKEFRGVEAVAPGKGYPSGEYKAESWSLQTPAAGARDAVVSGWAHTWQDDQRTIALVGRCAAEDMQEMQSLWELTAKKLKLAPPRTTSRDDRQREQLLRDYERSKYRGIDYRMKVREDMVKPWKAEDTENYIVIYNTKDQPLVRKILRDLESLRKEFVRQFPPAGEVTAVSTVRVCKDRNEYIAYGGHPLTAGYWNYVEEELVLYDAEKQGAAAGLRDAMTFVVLYHEAFHQYIFYSCGGVSPHSWFNEGYGDYFGGALIKGGKVKNIGLNTMRAWTVEALAEGKTLYGSGGVRVKGLLDFEKMIRLPKSVYYSDRRGYATGWSMIYFLKSKEAQKRKDWAAILPTYFETLQKAWKRELKYVSDPGNVLARQPAVEAAREVAVKAAFEGIDLPELNQAWLRFTKKLNAKRPK